MYLSGEPMNSPLHLISQIINSYWLSLMTSCVFLLLQDAYFPGLQGGWLLLVLGVLMVITALVSSGYERLVDRTSGVISGGFEFVVGQRTWTSLFKVYLVGVALGALTLLLVGVIFQGAMS